MAHLLGSARMYCIMVLYLCASEEWGGEEAFLVTN
jgi:hypothetical protein